MTNITISIPRRHGHPSYCQQNEYWGELQDMEFSLSCGADISIGCHTVASMSDGTDEDVVVHDVTKVHKKARAWSHEDAWFQLDAVEDEMDLLILQVKAGKVSREVFRERILKMRERIRRIKQTFKLTD